MKEIGEPVGSFYTWWAGDPLPRLTPLPGLRVEPADRQLDLLAHLNRLGHDEALRRLDGGHRPYLAYLGDEPVAYGWSASREATIGELGIRLVLPPGNRYLWDFLTLPAWRGQNVYPHLLQAILSREVAEERAARFWIGHDHANTASARGILRAGFQRVGDLYVLPGRDAEVWPSGPLERAEAGARLLGVPLADAEHLA